MQDHQMPYPFTRGVVLLDGHTYTRNMDAADIMAEFGVTKWPDHSMAVRVINNRQVWVREKTRESMEMRVFTHCPGCGKVFALGKLAQHMRMEKRRELGQPMKRGAY